MSQALIQRMQAPGPKKILACDGGGIRGLMSVEILAKLEDDLRVKLGRGSDFVLADYFDFACGTSTGAVISACIACGMPMAHVRKFYLQSGEQMFDKAMLFHRLNFKYNDEPLAKLLQSELSKALGADTTLGSPGLRTLLMMVMRNASTDSPWPISNNPFAKYNALARKDCNLRLPLWQLVRASTAAPTYFPPEVITIGESSNDTLNTFIFVDGGVTTYNNPAFLGFQMATAAPYAVNWATGTDKLLVVSIGTGGAAMARPELQANDMHLIYN
ncbi:MAG: patatin-like phospholipase family protein, partial [Rhizobacter sp.]|nr:patatin-like phospholipase family protein [Rhizobacter sp.]